MTSQKIDLSILITNYNLNCSRLLYDLNKQAKVCNNVCEIIVIDDASTDSMLTRQNLDACKALEHVNYICNTKNIGQASCRNKLANLAKGDWIIFIDSDAEVVSNDFINKYWQSRNNAEVVVGGLLHPAINPNPQATLRYKYERNADMHRDANTRNKNPYASFSAFNIMVRKEVFMQIRFDEQCTEYGYEDALFGMDLKDKNISITHIDNILIHTGLDSNESFLRKTETALRTLNKLRKSGKMRTGSKVGEAADRLKRLHLSGLVRQAFRLTRKTMLRNLLSDNPSLTIFSLYKLGYFVTISKE